MTFADLFETLTTRGVLPRAKDCKTALRLLAQALGAPSWDECQVEAACRDEAIWGKALDTHFAHLQTTTKRTISAPHRRNIRSNLRTVFKVAAEHGLLAVPMPQRLLTTPVRHLFDRQQQVTSPYRASYASQRGPRAFGLPQRQWPPDIAEGWRDYQERCGLRLRATTFTSHARTLVSYLGFLAHVVGRTPTWEDLFDVAQLKAFVRWHAERVGRPGSAQGRCVVLVTAAIANVVQHSNARAVADFHKTLKVPAPLHTKRLHSVALRDLEAVADACLTEGRASYKVYKQARLPGLRQALRFQKGLILKLLVRAPLRQRNVRELQLDKHLYKDDDGSWQLHFAGDDLKIGTRSGRVNEYKLNLTEDTDNLVPVLEEFIRDYRPRLPGAATSPFLFLTQFGTPYTASSLGHELSSAVHMRTGKRWFPHMVRTTWATENLTSEDAPDWTTVAVMLGDKVATVMASYHDLADQAHHPKARAMIARRLRTG